VSHWCQIKILAFDHNKDHLLSWARTMLFPATAPDSGKLSQFVDGMAFHWYSGNDRLLDGTYGYESVNATHHLAPDKILMATEGCNCPGSAPLSLALILTGVEIDSWFRAERLGHDVLYDLNHFAQGWIDWNLLVDSQGGPNHLGNLCDAPIVAREDFSRFHLQPKYFYLGHFSKFIPPLSKRVQVRAVGDYQFKRFRPILHSGLEAGLYPCEHSVKQMWVWHPDAVTAASASTNTSLGSLRLSVSGMGETEKAEGASAQPAASGADKSLVEFCLSRGDAERDYLTVWECPPVTSEKDDPRAARALAFAMLPSPTKKTDRQTLQLRYDLYPPGATNGVSIPYCVTLAPDSGLLQLKPCSAQSVNQQWVYRPGTGEIQSARPDRMDHCVTAGWPYLSATGYLTPSNQVAVVVMNEAPVDTYLTLRQASAESESTAPAMVVALHAHAIETIVFTPASKTDIKSDSKTKRR
jgi:hypothetical protein